MELKKIEVKKKQISRREVAIHLLLLLLIILALLPDGLIKRPSILGEVTSSVRILGAFPPQFAHDIFDTITNQTAGFFLDVNCTDQDVLANIAYYDNFTGFAINQTSGEIRQPNFTQSFVGNHTILIACIDLSDSSPINQTKVFTLTIRDVNEPPILSSIGNQIAIHGQSFFLDLNAFDPENDTLVFGSSSSLFSINPQTGVVNFTPTISMVGNYSINFTVFDGEYYDHEVILLRINLGPFCGDLACSAIESCATCPSDCGVCPIPPPSDIESNESQSNESESGQTSDSSVTGTGGSAPPPPYYRCDELWECSAWNTCSLSGLRERNCKDINRCGTVQKKPSIKEECEYQPTCEDGIQNGGEAGIDCGGPCEPCITANCFDGIQNQQEAGIDCGGPCEKECTVTKFAKIPVLEIPAIIELQKRFPWILLLIAAILILLMLIADRIYLHHLSKKYKLDEYRRRKAEYLPWRRRLHKAAINLIVVSLLTSCYIYWFSTDYEDMLKYSWILLILLSLVPASVSYALQHYRYYEYERLKKEQRLKARHRREILQLIKAENSLLKDFETLSNTEMYQGSKDHLFDSNPSLYSNFMPFYSALNDLIKKRKDRITNLLLEEGSQQIAKTLLADKTLKKFSKDYAEFDVTLRSLRNLLVHEGEEQTDNEEELIDQIEDLAKPHLQVVITSDKDLTKAYNQFVDLYNSLTEKKARIAEDDKAIFELERGFTDRVREVTKDSQKMQQVSADPNFTRIYNNFVQLFNHYTKKQQLRKAIENL